MNLLENMTILVFQGFIQKWNYTYMIFFYIFYPTNLQRYTATEVYMVTKCNIFMKMFEIMRHFKNARIFWPSSHLWNPANATFKGNRIINVQLIPNIEYDGKVICLLWVFLRKLGAKYRNILLVIHYTTHKNKVHFLRPVSKISTLLLSF